MSSTLPRLAYVVHSLNPGGTEKLVVQMSLAFAADFTVQVICLDEPGLWANDLRAQGIMVYSLGRQPGLDLSVSVRLASIFRRDRIQIIHAHQYTPWFYSALSRILFPSPKLLFEEHGRFFPEFKNYKRILFNKAVIRPLTHRVVAVSEDIKERLHCYEGLNCKATQVIYNGGSPNPSCGEMMRTEIRESLRFKPSDFVIGTVGRFDSIKNLPLLVKSIHSACQEAPNIRGLLVGDGPVFADLNTLVERLALIGKIHLTGYREDAPKLIHAMDLFVLSSFSEGTSMALLESMAAGIPVVVTDVGGNPEIVMDNQTGWVVPSDSISALAAAILEASKNPKKRHMFAVAGRLRFEERFTICIMCERYKALYNELLASQEPDYAWNS